MRTRVTILGSTGSIGQNALDVIRTHPDRFEVVGLAVHSNVDGLAAQIHEFRPRTVAICDEGAVAGLSGTPAGVKVLRGPEGVVGAASEPADVVLCGIVGAAGLSAVLAALDAGNRVALANKEPMVMAGRLIMARARERGVQVLPVDSEHNAIFQCLEGHDRGEVQRIYLTASGGPFYGRPRSIIEGVTPEQATRHPTWNMGAKISVDSATLMNKGLEVIEAMRLFDMPLDTFEVVIHPQSVVHALVEFRDGSILAHLGVTDMRAPIQFALTWPDRIQCPAGRLDLTTLQAITFAPPDFSEFPCLSYAIEAARRGGTIPAVLNAANEEAVKAFCERRIPFLSVSEVVNNVLSRTPIHDDDSLEAILDADTEARRMAKEAITRTGVSL